MYLKTGIILASLVAFYLLLVFAASNVWQGLFARHSARILHGRHRIQHRP